MPTERPLLVGLRMRMSSPLAKVAAPHCLCWTRALMIGLGAALLLSLPARGQAPTTQRKSTEKRLKQLEKQIQREKQRLQETRKAEKATQKKLKSLQREIALREKLVSTYQTRLTQLGRERSRLRDTLATLQQRLATLRDEYQRRLVHAYKYGRLHDLALLLASRSINQMLIRAQYLERFADDRREQRSAIRRAAQEIRTSRKKLAEKRAQTRQLLAEARTERQNLRALQRERRKVIEKLQARRSELKEEIEEKQRQARELKRRIRKLVAGAESGAPDATSENRPSEVSAALSASFKQNRGSLAWPVEGAVTVDFGNRVDPVHGTSTYHPGILIATSPRSPVQAVFDGIVSGIDFVPGYGTYVVIRHGEYLSVYSNFSSLDISEDQRIEAGQVIGQAGTENEPRGASLFFGVVNRASSEFVDPTKWLSGR